MILRRQFTKEWLATKIACNPDTNCWEWTGALFRNGYGALKLDGKTVRVHRVVWALYRGDAGSFHVLHTCDNRKCCNPDHLYLGTHADNMADRLARGHYGHFHFSSAEAAQ